MCEDEWERNKVIAYAIELGRPNNVPLTKAEEQRFEEIKKKYEDSNYRRDENGISYAFELGRAAGALLYDFNMDVEPWLFKLRSYHHGPRNIPKKTAAAKVVVKEIVDDARIVVREFLQNEIPVTTLSANERKEMEAEWANFPESDSWSWIANAGSHITSWPEIRRGDEMWKRRKEYPDSNVQRFATGKKKGVEFKTKEEAKKAAVNAMFEYMRETHPTAMQNAVDTLAAKKHSEVYDEGQGAEYAIKDWIDAIWDSEKH